MGSNQKKIKRHLEYIVGRIADYLDQLGKIDKKKDKTKKDRDEKNDLENKIKERRLRRKNTRRWSKK